MPPLADPAPDLLLTGATGFVGRAVLAEALARGMAVTAVSRQAGPARAGLRWRAADLLQPAGRALALAGPVAPVLVHGAWYVEHGAFWTSELNAAWRVASAELVRGFVENGGKVVVALGSCAEYAPLPDGGAPWAEDRALGPVSPYGAAKVALHDDLAAICAAAGAQLVWARLFHLTGRGEDRRRFLPQMADALRGGRVALVRAAELRRDFAPTDHVARALLQLARSDAAAGAVNVGAGAGASLGDYARLLADRLGRPDLLDLRHAPPAGEPFAMLPDLGRMWRLTGLGPLGPQAAVAAVIDDMPPNPA